jgi:hypothetical protein
VDDQQFQDQKARANHHRVLESRQSRLCRNQTFGAAGPGRRLSREEIRSFERELLQQANTDRRRTTP